MNLRWGNVVEREDVLDIIVVKLLGVRALLMHRLKKGPRCHVLRLFPFAPSRSVVLQNKLFNLLLMRD